MERKGMWKLDDVGANPLLKVTHVNVEAHKGQSRTSCGFENNGQGPL